VSDSSDADFEGGVTALRQFMDVDLLGDRKSPGQTYPAGSDRRHSSAEASRVARLVTHGASGWPHSDISSPKGQSVSPPQTVSSFTAGKKKLLG